MNDTYIEEFRQELLDKKLTKKTIEKHIFNIDFFLNTYYLDRFENESLSDAASYIDDFLGYFFIYKCLWSSSASVKAYGTSFKKFFKLMYEKGHIDKETYEDMLIILKENLNDWAKEASRLG